MAKEVSSINFNAESDNMHEDIMGKLQSMKQDMEQFKTYAISDLYEREDQRKTWQAYRHISRQIEAVYNTMSAQIKIVCTPDQAR